MTSRRADRPSGAFPEGEVLKAVEDAFQLPPKSPVDKLARHFEPIELDGPDPERFCTGDPDAPDFAWCGEPATHVAGVSQGGGRWRERFACPKHFGICAHRPYDRDSSIVRLVPVADFFKVVREQIERSQAAEAVEMLRTPAGKGVQEPPRQYGQPPPGHPARKP